MKKNKKRDESYSGLITPLDLKKPSGKIANVLVSSLIIIISLFCILPFIWAFMSGLKTTEEFYSIPATIFPKKLCWENITELFTVYEIQNYVINSIVMILGTLIVELTTSTMGGYVLSRLKPKGSKLLFTLILWTMMMPNTLSMVPLFMTFVDFPIFHFNLMGTYFPMWIIAGANCYHILMFKDFFDKIPASYIEAAKIDGAGRIKIFFKIILPLSKPILATVSVFVISASWNSFMWPLLILTEKDTYPVSLALYKLQSNLQAPKALMFSALMVVPMIIVYFISQRFIVRNSVNEGDKG